MTYRAPVGDIAFALRNAAGFGPALAEGLYGDLSDDVIQAVLEEAGRFATHILAPLNPIGDQYGTQFKDGTVTTAPGWKEAYRAWTQAGWNGLAAPTQWGGQGLPQAVNAACIEMWNSAAMAFGLGPVAPRLSAQPTAAIASPDRRFSSPTASTTSPTTSSIWCWPGCPTPRRGPRAFRSFLCPNSC